MTSFSCAVLEVLNLRVRSHPGTFDNKSTYSSSYHLSNCSSALLTSLNVMLTATNSISQSFMKSNLILEVSLEETTSYIFLSKIPCGEPLPRGKTWFQTDLCTVGMTISTCRCDRTWLAILGAYYQQHDIGNLL